LASLGLDRPRPASSLLTAEEATKPEAWFGDQITKQRQRIPSREIKIVKVISKVFQQFLADLERVFSRRLRFRLRLDTDCPREVSSGVFAVLIRVGTTLVLATSRLPSA
jgi:hypothetical protein